MKAKPVKARPTVATVADVYRQCPAALAVWTVLGDLAVARGTPTLTPTRTELATAAGVSAKTVSRGLTVLEKAGWLDRVHVPVVEGGRQTATLLRLTLRRVPLRGTTPTRRRGRSRVATVKSAVEGVKGPIARGRSRPQDFPKGKGVRCVSLRERPHLEETRETEPPAESPIARLEREALDRIRAARLAGDPTPTQPADVAGAA